ncbi:MAG: bifunctional riboflavin kinase/FAD synthetase [Bacteroidales bacterium]|nr:bifunctional riboflavin kinase/FAD synthetase [Bacteroidales bacterium]
MKIYHNLSDFRGSNFAVVTVGTFDGLHIGHQMIIARMKEFARQNSGDIILVTFDPHPRQVLNSNKTEIKFISTQKRKIELLDRFGIDHMIVIPFTREFAATSSEDFIREYLVKKLRAKMLIVGYDHHFGKNREGNYEKLKSLGKAYGFEVEEIPAQFVDGIAVSSTKIRTALREGDVETANKMLGYEYSITGKVIEGNKIGRKIGFPTANIDVGDEYKLIAAGGVYACKVDIEGDTYFGMGNIGTRPTIGKHDFTTEVHIFDFNREIYGKEITIFFLNRIREEQKFENLDKLKEQLHSDKERVKRLFDDRT